MKENPLRKLETFGQSIWLDFIRRCMLADGGELSRLIEEDGLGGVTSNPSIFEKSIGGSHDYDEAIRSLARAGKGAQEVYRTLVVDDIRSAADLFRPTYDRLDGRDGFVSLEVSPHLAHDTQGTVAQARDLWAAVDRPNVLIKVPGTREGLPAIRQLISEGINVNVTLLFGLPRYREVAEAYIAGLEDRLSQGQPIERTASVASFFLSRIDVLLDPMLEKVSQRGGADAEAARSLVGKVATASARTAYQIYKGIFAGERFQSLAARGARPQRLLWASTSTKNPVYSDAKYVEPLIGPDTVNTVPLATLNAYRDHGNPAPRLEEGAQSARDAIEQLQQVGIDIDRVTARLEDEGVRKFIEPFDRLMDTLEKRCTAALLGPLDGQTLSLGEDRETVEKRIENLEKVRFSERLWRKDVTLWEKAAKDSRKVGRALGWLHVAEKMEESCKELTDFAAEVREAGFRRVVHMGMGGSSLTPLVLRRILGLGPEGLPLTVLDSTDPGTILDVQREGPLADAFFVVASKSGNTAEPMAFGDYFYRQVSSIKGAGAGESFAAITDPGTPLARLAGEWKFRRTFLNFADIGGRYSALSYFGLVPAALMGLPVSELLSLALRMAHACASGVPPRQNPGVVLGAVMGELALAGRSKVTFLAPEAIKALPLWLEQLLAESTGKSGTGLLPVAGESLGDPKADYGEDRLFVHFHLNEAPDENLERGAAAVRRAGHPLVTIRMDNRLDVAEEFFRWEMAVAAAGFVLGINPFDQPNVQESKDNTERLLQAFRETGKLPEPIPVLREEPLRFYADERADSAAGLLKKFLGRARPGDYIAIQAFLKETAEADRMLGDLRLRLRDALHLATTVGYGPRFLHSTGQLHKGGPDTGLFLQLCADDTEDVEVVGQPYSFGLFKRAQALGDFEALRKRGRRIIGVNVGKDVGRGLSVLQGLFDTFLPGR
jgi:transaldolase/glucose-6-phosphate isomerase